MKIGIVSRLDRPDAIKCAKRVYNLLASGGYEVLLEYNLWRLAGRQGDPFTIGDRVDMLLVIGGDGTLLRVLHYYSTPVRVAGVKVGRRGYYMSFECNDPCLDKIARGDYVWCSFTRLGSLRMDDGAKLPLALNEVAIIASRGKVVELELSVRGGAGHVIRIAGDGVIIASPSGSHAYNLSARGPLISHTDTIVVTPLNPLVSHESMPSSLVLSGDSVLEVRNVNGYRTAWVVVDGQVVYPFPINSVLRVFRGSEVYIAYPEECPLTAKEG